MPDEPAEVTSSPVSQRSSLSSAVIDSWGIACQRTVRHSRWRSPDTQEPTTGGYGGKRPQDASKTSRAMKMKLAHRRAWLDARAEKFRKDMLSVYQQVRVLLLLLKHPRVRWYAKAVASGPILYVLSPIQLIPTFIPVIGQMDDLFVVWAGMKLVRKLTP